MNEWTPTGAPGGSATAIAFSPQQRGVVLAGAGWGLYRSVDGGQAWTTVREGMLFGGASSIVVDPSNGSRIMVATINRLYRSDDGGLNFQVIGGPSGTGTPGTVRKLVFARDGSVLYAVTHTNKVFRTVNFAATWEDRSGTLPSSNHMTDLVVDPNVATTLYAISEAHGLYRSVDGGLSWSLNPALLASVGLRKLAIDPTNSSYLLMATVDGGLLESRDGGTTWAVEDPNRYAWVGFHNSGVGAAMAIPWRGSVVRRVDRDAPWTAGASLNAANFFDAAFDPHDSDSIDASSLFVATSGEPLFTADGGTTFAVRSQGLRGRSVTQLSAADDGTIYAAYFEGPVGVHRRSAGSWAPVDNAELMSRLVNFFNPLVMAVDPTDSNVLLVGSSAELVRSHDGGETWTFPSIDANVAGRLPRSLSWARSNSQHVYLGLDNGFGVVVSENAGLAWQARSSGLPTGANGPSGVGAIGVDPTNSLTAYAGVFLPQAQPALYKTTNGGVSWEARSDGLDLLNLQAIAVAPSSNETVYAGAAIAGAGVAKSSDAGQTWQRVGTPIHDVSAYALAIDPVVPTTVYMTANLVTGGASRSVDGGATWEHLPQGVIGLGLVGKMVLDPVQPGQLLAAAPHYGLMEFTVAPDLETTIDVVPVVGFGASATATARVHNLGPFAASAASLRIMLPPGVTASVPSPQQGACAQAGAAFECALGAVRVGQTVATTVTLSAGNAAASGSLAASITAREPDPVLANNQASAPVAVTRVANMVVMLGTSATTVAQGAAVVLTAIARNDGPQESPATELVVDVGAGFTYQSASVTQGNCTAGGARVTCALGALANAAEASATITVVASGAGTLTASATVSTSIADAVATNNAAAANVTSQAPASGGGGGGGGGGGASSVAELLFLLAALLFVTWQRESSAATARRPEPARDTLAAPSR